MVRVDEETHHKLLLAKMKTDKSITSLTKEAINEYLKKLGILAIFLFVLTPVFAFIPPEGFRYYVPVTISSPEELNAYQVAVTLDTASLVLNGKLKGDCSDLWVVDSEGNPVPFYVEDCPSTQTRIWVKTDLSPVDSRVFYIVYDNPNAEALSDPEAVFDFYDDFKNLSKWAVESSSYIHQNDFLRIERGFAYTQLPFNVQDGYMVEMKVRVDSLSGYGYSGTFPELCSSYYTASHNANADATVLYMVESGWHRGTVRYWIGTGRVTNYDGGLGSAGWSVTEGEWYVTGVSIAGPRDNSTLRFWKDGEVVVTVSGLSWEKDMHYIHIGTFVGDADVEIKPTTYDWIRVRKYSETVPIVELGTEKEVEREEQGGQEENQNNQGTEGAVEGGNNLPIILWFAVAVGVAFFPVEFPLKAVIYIMMVMLGFGLGVHEQHGILVGFPFALMFYEGAKWYFGRGK